MKKNTLIRIPFLLNSSPDASLIFVLILLLAGCVGIQPVSETSNDRVEITSEASTIIITSTMDPIAETPTKSPTTMAQLNFTQEPTKATIMIPTSTAQSTETPTLAPSLTPYPMIPPEQRGEKYDELMATNNGCQLPCWWGLKLGESSLEEVVQLYAQFEPFITIQDFAEGVARVTIKFVDPEIEDGIQTTHTFRGKDGIVLEAEIQVRKYDNFTPLSLMEQFGQPFEIWLWTIPEPFEGILPASFRFYFPENGILTGYRELAGTKGDNVEICLNGNGNSILLLWDPAIWGPNKEMGFIERANASSELSLEGHQRIGEVSSWDEEVFFANVTDSNSTGCLETPSSLWSPP